MRVLQILSGGMDSATLALWHLSNSDDLMCLSFNYGQRHRRELAYARRLCERYDIPWQQVDMPLFGELLPGSSLTDTRVHTPHGHYAAENMKQTVVPSRNAIMLSMAFGVAVAQGFDSVSFGAHAGDHTIYPDCRRPFIEGLEHALNLGVWQSNRVEILAPFITLRKTDIVRLGDNLGVPWEDTWTCYEGASNGVHCGLCGACQERKEAFSDAGVNDPTIYAGGWATI